MLAPEHDELAGHGVIPPAAIRKDADFGGGLVVLEAGDQAANNILVNRPNLAMLLEDV